MPPTDIYIIGPDTSPVRRPVELVAVGPLESSLAGKRPVGGRGEVGRPMCNISPPSIHGATMPDQISGSLAINYIVTEGHFWQNKNLATIKQGLGGRKKRFLAIHSYVDGRTDHLPKITHCYNVCITL